MTPKIYKITNDINGRIYVGQTWKSLEERFSRHCAESRWKNTKSMPIVFAIKKYGQSHFKIDLLEELSPNENQNSVNDREVYWGLLLNTLSPSGYNLKLGGSNGKCSDEVRKKIGDAHRGKTITEETRRRLVESHRGFVPSEITRQKLSAAFRGKPPSKNTNIGASKKNSKTYRLKSPDGNVMIVSNMKAFCREHRLLNTTMSGVASGKKKSHRGWTVLEDMGFNNPNRTL